MTTISSTIARNLNPSAFSYATKLKLALATSISSVAIGILTSLPLVIVAGVLTGTYTVYKAFTYIHALEKHQTQLQTKQQQLEKTLKEFQEIAPTTRSILANIINTEPPTLTPSRSPEKADVSPPRLNSHLSGSPQTVSSKSPEPRQTDKENSWPCSSGRPSHVPQSPARRIKAFQERNNLNTALHIESESTARNL